MKKYGIKQFIALIIAIIIIIICFLVPFTKQTVFKDWIIGGRFIGTVIFTSVWLVSFWEEIQCVSSCETDFNKLTENIISNNKKDQTDLSEEAKNRLQEGQLWNADKRVEAHAMAMEAKRNCLELLIKFFGVIGIIWLNIGSWL